MFDRNVLERRARAKRAEWRGLLTRNVECGWEMLRLLLDGPIRFSPVLVSRPRDTWRKCRSAAPRWQGATSENIGHI